MGGITTFLGTVPLAFSSSEIFTSVFIAFIALVVLGITHGLILLPVILSIFGTEDSTYRPKGTICKDSMTPTESEASEEDECGKAGAIGKIEAGSNECEEEEDDMFV
jgi:Niemann-Pick C1 protein